MPTPACSSACRACHARHWRSGRSTLTQRRHEGRDGKASLPDLFDGRGQLFGVQRCRSPVG